MPGTKNSDDMSIIEDDEEEVEPVTASLPTFDFTFNKSAWDDQELVHAYDAAMSEFHTHHPGPGSWLDKATAALAKGRPLPGSNGYDTEWFTASLPEPEPAIQLEPAINAQPSHQQQPHSLPTRTGPPPPKKSRKSRQPNQPTYDNPLNPYVVTTHAAGPSNQSPRLSPSYNPPSPPPHVTAQSRPPAWSRPHTAIQPILPTPIHHGEGRPLAGDDARIHPGPSIGSQQTGDVSHSEALSYAMTAQYWAGYWMGVAQVKSERPQEVVSNGAIVGEPVLRDNEYDLEPGQGVEAEETEEPSNVFTTQQHFARTNGLKR